MRSQWFNVLIFAWAALCVQSTAVQDFLEVKYNPKLILGERSTAKVTMPHNVFFSLYETFYAPNGTSTTSLQTTNVFDGIMPANASNGWIDPSVNETCVQRSSWLAGSTSTISRSRYPDSWGMGWGYSFTLNLYYSTGYQYHYYMNATNNELVVCIEKPFVVETLNTSRKAIEVQAAADGVTTTSFPATMTVDAGEETGTFVTEKWPLFPSAVGQAFTGAGQRFSTSWAVILTAILATVQLARYSRSCIHKSLSILLTIMSHHLT